MEQNIQKTAKTWQEMNNQEKKESFDKYEKFKLIEAHKTARADWQRDMTAQEVDSSIPYNASNGKTYSRDTSMLLRAEMAIKGYEKPQFVTMEQGNFMGGKLKFQKDENGQTKLSPNGKELRVQGVKTLYTKTYELRDKLDKDGKVIEIDVKDKSGNLITNQNGEVIKRPVKEKIPIKPTLETQTLYHISQFEGIKPDKVKERNLTAIKDFRERQKEASYEIKPNYERIDLGGNLAKQLEHLAIAQIKGIDYRNPIVMENAKSQEVVKEQSKKATKAKKQEKPKGLER